MRGWLGEYEEIVAWTKPGQEEREETRRLIRKMVEEMESYEAAIRTWRETVRIKDETIEANEETIRIQEKDLNRYEAVVGEKDRRITAHARKVMEQEVTIKELRAKLEGQESGVEKVERYKVLVERMADEASDARAREQGLQDQLAKMVEMVDLHAHLSVVLVETCQNLIAGPQAILKELQDTNGHLKAISTTLEATRVANSCDNR
jgi:chromosome segregation ATPase